MRKILLTIALAATTPMASAKALHYHFLFIGICSEHPTICLQHDTELLYRPQSTLGTREKGDDIPIIEIDISPDVVVLDEEESE